MKKKRILILSTILTLIFSTQFSYGKSITKEYTFKADSENVKYVAEKNIREDGKTYEFEKIKYEVVKAYPREIVKNVENLKEKNPEKEIIENNMKYVLKDAQYTEIPASGTKEYIDYQDSEIPKEIELKNSNDISFKGTLKGLSVRYSNSFDKPFTVSGTFYGDPEVNVFRLNGKEISIGNNPTFENYGSEILSYLKLNPDNFRLNQGRWQGTWQNVNGQYQRNAVFNGVRRSKITTATYNGVTYNAKVKYELAKGEKPYEVKAIVTYDNSISMAVKVAIGIGALIVFFTFAWILGLIKKKKREE